jgi:hypothetical protein
MKSIIAVILATQALSLSAREITTTVDDCLKNQSAAFIVSERIHLYNSNPISIWAQPNVYKGQYITFRCDKTIPTIVIETKEEWMQRQETELAIQRQRAINLQQQRLSQLDQLIK